MYFLERERNYERNEDRKVIGEMEKVKLVAKANQEKEDQEEQDDEEEDEEEDEDDEDDDDEQGMIKDEVKYEKKK
ncbi:MAG: hypothetical protein EZS28_019565 [Streblomastix strix]|uniref:Uncharacterized protein n=1 Tax=Streblomastix strix TaxID=222440 RepID=A0A5J4VQX1_9EUKA|nr:MAG: hypothetical protein EZS28_019565 [Streblomastix strix]